VSPKLKRLESRTFASLRHRNYRLFFGGQIVSQTGSWMQRIALGWFVLQITHSAFAVGVMAFAQFVPFMVFGLFAGVLTDRLDARRLVIGTQAAQLVSAAALTWIALAGLAQPWMLYLIAFANGMVLVLDVPSRQQLTYRMVGRDVLPNAIALNSSLFNASRIFGPAVAGMVYGFTGPGWCFFINAVTFLAVLLSLFAMRVRDFFPLEEFERPSILRGTREGLAFARTQKRMLVLLSLTVVLSTFCFNFNVTLPVLAGRTLHTSAEVYGLLSAVFGAGALIGSLGAAALGRASAKVMLAGSLLFTASELLLAPLRNPYAAGVLLFTVGVGFTAWSANSNAMVQLRAPDRLRGRIIGLYFYAFNGTGALAGLFAGWLCATGGTELAFAVGGFVGLIGTAAAGMTLFRGRPPRLELRRRTHAPQHA
jgi:MFS family permease